MKRSRSLDISDLNNEELFDLRRKIWKLRCNSLKLFLRKPTEDLKNSIVMEAFGKGREHEMYIYPTKFSQVFIYTNNKWNDPQWRISIEGNFEEGASYSLGNGDLITIKFTYEKSYHSFDIVTMQKVTGSKWKILLTFPDDDRREISSKIVTDEVMNFWKDTFDKIMF